MCTVLIVWYLSCFYLITFRGFHTFGRQTTSELAVVEKNGKKYSESRSFWLQNMTNLIKLPIFFLFLGEGISHIPIFQQKEMLMLENYFPDPWSAVSENICPHFFYII